MSQKARVGREKGAIGGEGLLPWYIAWWIDERWPLQRKIYTARERERERLWLGDFLSFFKNILEICQHFLDVTCPRGQRSEWLITYDKELSGYN